MWDLVMNKIREQESEIKYVNKIDETVIRYQ